MHLTIRKIIACITLAIIPTIATITAAPTASAATYPTSIRAFSNVASFNDGNASNVSVQVKASGNGRGLKGKASLYVDGHYKRSASLSYGWRGFVVDDQYLPDNRTVSVQIKVFPTSASYRDRTVTWWANDYKAPPQSSVVQVAKWQIGDPYRYGAAGPSRFDCSGLVQYAYRHATGKSLPHSSAAIRRSGTPVSHPRPGDVVYTPGHVSIYAGGGKVVEAARPGTRVRLIERWQKNPTYLRF